MYTSRRLHYFRLSTKDDNNGHCLIFPVKVYILHKHYDALQPDSTAFVKTLSELLNRNPSVTWPPEITSVTDLSASSASSTPGTTNSTSCTSTSTSSPDLRQPSSSSAPKSKTVSSLKHCGFLTQHRVFDNAPYLYFPPFVCEFELRDTVSFTEVVDLSVIDPNELLAETKEEKKRTKKSERYAHSPMAKKTLYLYIRSSEMEKEEQKKLRDELFSRDAKQRRLNDGVSSSH